MSRYLVFSAEHLAKKSPGLVHQVDLFAGIHPQHGWEILDANPEEFWKQSRNSLRARALSNGGDPNGGYVFL